jgi:hypothetical protein
MMMLDIHTSASADRAPVRDIEFVRIELSPLADGRVFMSVTATTIDEEGPDLLDQEIARGQVATIDDVLALIRAHVNIGARSTKEY